MNKLITILLATMMALTSVSADAAKRLGGGKSTGQQSSNVTQKQATPAPAQAASPPAPAAQPSRPWGAMLGGLAAGLGLAWLANSLGMGEAFGNIMMMMLIGIVAVAAITWIMRRRMPGNANTLAYQGTGTEAVVNQPTRFQGGSMIGSALTPSATWNIPRDFDVAGFESAAKTNFVSLQAAWDRADTAVLAYMMTGTMLTEIKQQLADRDKSEPHRTAVMSINARLLGIEETATEYMASVQFTGVIQETVGEEPAPFEEVWNMTKSKSTGGGWLVAGIQN